MLIFVTSNRWKFKEVSSILKQFGIKVKRKKLKLKEVQSNNLKEIAKLKALEAYQRIKKPLFVEDVAFYIKALNNFPGTLIAYIEKTIGNEGILKLLEGKDRKAKAVCCIGFCNGKILKTFEGIVNGKVSEKPRGKGWGFDPIFIPNGLNKTFGELEKNQISHRRKALEKFVSFLKKSGILVGKDF